MIKLKKKYVIGTHVMWFEIEMFKDFIDGLINLMDTVENKENVDIDLCFNLNQKLEKIDAGLFTEEEAVNLINQATKNCEVKKGLVMKSLRAALFGTLNGPDLIQSWVLLSRFSKDTTRISRFI